MWRTIIIGVVEIKAVGQGLLMLSIEIKFLSSLYKVVCLHIFTFCFYHNTQVKVTYALRAELYYLSLYCAYIMNKIQQTIP